MMFQTTFTDHAGNHQFSRIFHTLRGARTWKRYWDTKYPTCPITIWNGEAGGERLA